MEGKKEPAETLLKRFYGNHLYNNLKTADENLRGDIKCGGNCVALTQRLKEECSETDEVRVILTMSHANSSTHFILGIYCDLLEEEPNRTKKPGT